jgi:molybdopterin molybdotransferase
MISVEEAKGLVLESIQSLASKTIALEAAFGQVLAEDIFSPVDMPLFGQSAMDGYAVALSAKCHHFELIGEVKAGCAFPGILQKGQAIRIFTGAPVPQGADAVVMQEKVTVEEGKISFQGPPKINENIRLKGEQIQKGAVALRKGALLNPAAIGFLASLGITSVTVVNKPQVSILVTGDELQRPGEELRDGMIYESNSIMLKSALTGIGIEAVKTTTVKDSEAEVIDCLKEALIDSDVIIMSGGISVGKYDFSKTALEACGVESIFHKITQKPGKPLYFGMAGKKVVFALPGNPAAALSCFYEYVYPAINLLMGKLNPLLLQVKLQVKADFAKPNKLSMYLKGFANGSQVEILGLQGSHMLKSFAEANCLVYVPADKEVLNAGDWVDVHILPF